MRLARPDSSISSAHALSRAASPAPSPLMGAAISIPPPTQPTDTKSGSIAVRAMRSVRSMARLGGWGRSDSPTTVMGKRLASGSNNAKNATPVASGSGESWLVGARSSLGSRSPETSSQTLRLNAERGTSCVANKPIPPIHKATSSRRTSRLSTSTTASDESSIMPRDSTSTRPPSVQSMASNQRSTISSRRSSGVTSNAFWAPAQSIPEGEAPPPVSETKRDSTSTDRLKRGALANLFDISSVADSRSSTGSVSSRAANRQSSSSHSQRSRDIGSVESYGNPVTYTSLKFALGSSAARPIEGGPVIAIEEPSFEEAGQRDPFGARNDVESSQSDTMRGSPAAMKASSFSLGVEATPVRARPLTDVAELLPAFELDESERHGYR